MSLEFNDQRDSLSLSVQLNLRTLQNLQVPKTKSSKQLNHLLSFQMDPAVLQAGVLAGGRAGAVGGVLVGVGRRLVPPLRRLWGGERLRRRRRQSGLGFVSCEGAK